MGGRAWITRTIVELFKEREGLRRKDLQNVLWESEIHRDRILIWRGGESFDALPYLLTKVGDEDLGYCSTLVQGCIPNACDTTTVFADYPYLA